MLSVEFKEGVKLRSGEKSPPDSPAAMSTGTWDSVREIEMDEFDNESFGLNIDFLQYTMMFLMFAGGMFDIVATGFPKYLKDDPTQIPVEGMEGSFHFLGSFDWVHGKEFQEFIRWLDHHDVTVTFWFSAIWFLDSFVEANRRFRTATEKLERRRLTSSNKEEMAASKLWEDPSVVYWGTIFVQVLLLPVGFFFMLFYAADQTLDHEEVENPDEVDETIVVHFTDIEGEGDFTRSYTASSRISLIFALLQFAWLRLTSEAVRMAKTRITAQIKSLAPRLGRRLLGNAVFRPKAFRKNLKRVLTAARWFKYLAPIFGTANKLKGNVEDMLKKRRQAREAAKFKKIRQLVWEKKRHEVKIEDAAKMLQSAFRSRQARKRVNAIKLLKGDKEYFAALRLQTTLRRKLAEARERIAKKKLELERLKKMGKRRNTILTDDDKKRMYELQDELGSEASDLLNRKLLLRPNTKFAVIWKIMFITCVIFEIAQLAAKPWLENYKDKKTHEPMTMEEFVAKTVIPTKMSERTECHAPKPTSLLDRMRHPRGDEKDIAWYCQGPASAIYEATRDVIALSFTPAPVAEWPECQDSKKNTFPGRMLKGKHSPPKALCWYCDPTYVRVHNWYRAVKEFILEEFLLIVGIVCYMDVFVTFFTGELDPESGMLLPKPFFVRWILPGLLLQLLVNPIMGPTAGKVWSALRSLLKLGPVRVWRWYVAVFFPLGYALVYIGMQYFWMPFTAFENKSKVVEKTAWNKI